jgi:ankyrin repeat protein
MINLDELKKDYGYIKKDICFTKNINVIKLLLDEDLVDINAIGISGHTPIHFHAIEGNKEIVEFLLTKNADPYKKNIYGDSNAITGAKIYNQKKIYKILKIFEKNKITI